MQCIQQKSFLLNKTFSFDSLQKRFKYKMKTKNACKKRFRLTSSGKVKYYPSRLGGKPKIVSASNLTSNYKSLKVLLPNSTYLSPSLRMTPVRTKEEKRKKKLARRTLSMYENVQSEEHPLLLVKKLRQTNIE